MTYIAIDQAKARSVASWDWLPLRRLARPRRETNVARKETLLSLSADRGVERRAADGGRQLATEATQSSYWVVHPNDLVFNPMWALEGGVAVSSVRGAVSTAYRVYELSDLMHPRFLHHYLRSKVALEQYRAMVRGVTTFDRSVTREDLDGMPVPAPSVRVQRAIADYLDTEVARIDALIAKKQQMVSRLETRRWLFFLEQLSAADAPVAPLRRALRGIVDGPFGSAFSSSDYVDEGVGVVRLGNIGFARWRGDDLVYLPEERFAEFRGHAIRQGDLLIAALGDPKNHAGRACVAPDLGKAIVKGKCFRARVDPAVADPFFLALFCSSPAGSEAIATEVRGSTRSMINLDIMKSMQVRLPGLDVQRAIVADTSANWVLSDRLLDRLSTQIALLQEHRQALITAAVTGELEITGVAS